MVAQQNDAGLVGALLARAEQQLGHGLDLILDGGMTLNEPSTVIDLTGPRPLVLRQGKGHIEGLLA